MLFFGVIESNSMLSEINKLNCKAFCVVLQVNSTLTVQVCISQLSG